MKALVIDAGNKSAYGKELLAMHRLRHRLFVETLGWKDLARPDGLDIDAFDTDAATYLVILDADGSVRGSARFLPTTGPHMAPEVFAHFFDGDPPRGPTILEWSRHAPGDPSWAPDINEAARVALHLGVLEFARLRGVTAFTAVMETWLLRRARAIGWPCEPLGPQRAYGEGMAQAVRNPVAPGHLDWLRAKVARRDPVLLFDAAEAA